MYKVRTEVLAPLGTTMTDPCGSGEIDTVCSTIMSAYLETREQAEELIKALLVGHNEIYNDAVGEPTEAPKANTDYITVWLQAITYGGIRRYTIKEV